MDLLDRPAVDRDLGRGMRLNVEPSDLGVDLTQVHLGGAPRSASDSEPGARASAASASRNALNARVSRPRLRSE